MGAESGFGSESDSLSRCRDRFAELSHYRTAPEQRHVLQAGRGTLEIAVATAGQMIVLQWGRDRSIAAPLKPPWPSLRRRAGYPEDRPVQDRHSSHPTP